jgi:FkbM family methyltransferase
MLIELVGSVARRYLMFSPWNKGRYRAYTFLQEHLTSQHRRLLARTKFGDLMELQTPDVIGSVIYSTGQWEPLITRYIRGHLHAGDIFVDVGANIGYYTLLAAHLVGPSGHVYAIEASPSMCERLVRNVRLNDYRNVSVIQGAVAEKKGEVSLFKGDELNLGHSTTIEALAEREGLALEGRVNADTLEHFVGGDELRRARFIKVDVEGAEFSVLAPLFESLDDFNPETEWLLELSPMHSPGGQVDIDTIFTAFLSRGYTAYGIDNRYERDFYIYPPDGAGLEKLNAPPHKPLYDVLMRRTPTGEAPYRHTGKRLRDILRLRRRY